MNTSTRSRAFASALVALCLLVAPLTVYAKKGEKNFNQGMKYEAQQQWEQAAQEFALALAASPSDTEFRLHYQRSIFNASQAFMQKGRSAEEQGDYQGAYNAYRQAYGYDPVNELALSEMARMLRLQTEKTNGTGPEKRSVDGVKLQKTAYTEATQQGSPQIEQKRVITFAAGTDLKQAVKELARALDLNVVFDNQSFRSPRTFEIYLKDVTTAQALDLIFIQEGLFFQKMSRRTILVADQSRRPQFQQLVIRTFYLANAAPEDVQRVIQQAIPAQAGRTQSIVIPDKTTNSLTIRDTLENIRIFEDLIRSIDKDRAEVVMDVNIYEVTHTDLLQFGNQVGGEGSLVNLGGTSSGFFGIGGSRTAITNAVAGVLPVALGAGLIIPSSGISALQKKGNTRLLASTQVHAFNGEESSARIGQRVPVQTAQTYPFGYSGNTEPKGGGTGTQSSAFGGGFPVINYEPTGLTFKFTPQVFPNQDVQVKMSIESKDVFGENTLTPTFTERTISGTARIQNNRTMMLASVATEAQSESRAGLPWISFIPIIGRLFTAPNNTKRQLDIVIAVTPRVLRSPAITPEDEMPRETGSVSTPTSSSLADMVRQEDEDDRIAAARRLPTNAVIELPDTVAETPGYVPATGSSSAVAPTVNSSQVAAPQGNAPAVTPKPIDSSARTLNIAQTADGPSSLVESKTPLARLVENAVNNGSAANVASLADLQLMPESSRLGTGEKQRFGVMLVTPSPVGTAVLALKFDYRTMVISAVLPGSLLTGPALGAPTISQYVTLDGTLMVTVIPPAGGSISGSGALIYVDVEALAPTTASLSVLKGNVHLMGTDGSNISLK
ncbi:MAG: secretin N-terminal domain-containing protein [Pyrinomonadaceae bacterium]